ncbi:MAG: cytochrome P450 [Nitrospira sp.]|nr:MAG: cytochrome P450 [Nitrospira sp.]
MTNQAIPATSLPGPPVSRWFGFFPEFRQDSLGFLLRCHSYGDVAKLPMGRMAEFFFRHPDLAMYFLNHPDDVKHVLVTNQHNYTKTRVPPGESLVFGKGVLHTEGETHHHQRRLFLPFFHRDHVASYAGLITEKAAALATSWHDGAKVDIGREMTQLTLSIIWRLLFGRDVSSDATQVAEALTAGHYIVSKQYNSLLAWITPLWVPTTQHRRFFRGQQFIDGRIRSFIQNRRAPQHQNQNEDMLSLLLAATDEAGQPLSDKEIRDELVTFMIAGHDTTANALTWTWYLLSQSSTVRTRLAHELETVLGNRLPTAADMPRLLYTKMIWEEALRLYPPAWLLHARKSRAEDRLPSGVLLQADTRVVHSPWSMHRNARWFPDPNRFDPDRFSPEAKQARLAFSYFPFGGGGRRCLGESFAELEGLLIVATLSSKFRLRLVEGQTILPDPLMTLRPKVPVHMTIESVSTPEPHPTTS